VNLRSLERESQRNYRADADALMEEARAFSERIQGLIDDLDDNPNYAARGARRALVAAANKVDHATWSLRLARTLLS
jgi:alpha-D-ribose 1-methylphosphonate 5-triphosphate synthase subunit PhnG